MPPIADVAKERPRKLKRNGLHCHTTWATSLRHRRPGPGPHKSLPRCSAWCVIKSISTTRRIRRYVSPSISHRNILTFHVRVLLCTSTVVVQRYTLPIFHGIISIGFAIRTSTVSKLLRKSHYIIPSFTISSTPEVVQNSLNI